MPFLGDARPAVRAAAVRALDRLGELPDHAAFMITDPSARVVKAVARALPHAPSPARLRELVAPGRPPHVRRNAFWLLTHGPLWTRIGADLLLADDPQLGDAARDDLRRLVRDGGHLPFTPPPPELADHLRRARLEPPLEAHLRRLLGAGARRS
ncbi:hypothetical protein [Actinomadura parmotrematis]|uniref:HEAT repeat domain-containing protein n=1 Tax=Actinomadura parmotrematis TaxID=2864039 RepID=A0ABS7FMX2_9ACTN|nr:hypothetical protein [Actinomadura parmotrematis]MBW8481732.1 hypothetical protein [Actinomadura parmotrematis]